ncbi:hypothetical protein GF342_00860 [Candidatus Woesearchaeota archaeon]|nr:hypothetical protein [Candidatus Woesearchaeota archaeon]
MHEHDENCGPECEEPSMEEVLSITEDKVDALIQVLIDKKIITEEEITNAVDALYPEEEDDEDSDEDNEE